MGQLVLALALLLSPLAVSAADLPSWNEGPARPTPERWTVTAAPYLWAARLDGDAKVRGIKADVDVSFQDTLENLNVAGMALIEARKGRFGFAVNPLFVRTQSDAESGPLEADNTTDIATMGASLFYRAVELDLGRNGRGDPQSLAIEPLVGARLNWLLSHGKGKSWGTEPKKFIQIDIEPKEMDSNVEIVAPVVGDIGSCVDALLQGMGEKWPAAPADWAAAVSKKREENVAKMAPRLMNNNVPMDYHGALGVLKNVIAERPDAILVNEGANTLDLARGIIDIHKPRKRIDVGTWGIMGIGMGYAIAAAVETGKPVLCVEGDSAFGFSGMEVETICRYKLPVCIVIFNNDGIYRGTDVNAASSDPATTVFVKGARYDRMMEAFGGVGVNATSPDELRRAVNAAMDSGQPTLINAVIDPAAGSESGRIGNLNPQSALKKK